MRFRNVAGNTPPLTNEVLAIDRAGPQMPLQILEKAPQVRVLGRLIDVRARVSKINGFSAHADRKALTRWLDALKRPPRRVFVTHGDGSVVRATAERIRRERGWTVEAPEYLEIWDLD